MSKIRYGFSEVSVRPGPLQTATPKNEQPDKFRLALISQAPPGAAGALGSPGIEAPAEQAWR